MHPNYLTYAVFYSQVRKGEEQHAVPNCRSMLLTRVAKGNKKQCPFASQPWNTMKGKLKTMWLLDAARHIIDILYNMGCMPM